MPSRICRCLTCPSCHTRYATRHATYANGASIAADPAAADLFKLCCACGQSYLFKRSQLQTFVLTQSAYLRGYGSPDEIMPIARRKAANQAR